MIAARDDIVDFLIDLPPHFDGEKYERFLSFLNDDEKMLDVFESWKTRVNETMDVRKDPKAYGNALKKDAAEWKAAFV